MSEEIKEILYLQNYIDKYKSDEKAIIKGNRLTTPAMLDYLEVKALLNYITSLQQKVEQLEKELQITANKCKQLENIRKEAIEFMKENCDIITIDKGWIIRSELTTTGLGKLFKILNKGE